MTSVKQSSNSTDASSQKRGGLGSFLLLAAGTFVVGTGGFVMAGILPGIAESLDISVSTASLLIAIYALVFAIGAPVIAIFTPRMSRTTLMVGGLAIYSIGNVMAAVLPTFGLVLAGRLVSAVGAAAFIPAATAAAAAIAAPEKRGRAIAIVSGGFAAATALGAPIGTAIGAAFTWHAALWFVVIVGVVVATGLALVLRKVPIPPVVSIRQRLAPLTKPNVAMPLITILIVVAAQYSAYTFFSQVHDRATGGDGTVLAILLFVYGASSTIGNLVSGSLCDRFGNRLVVRVSLILLIVTFAITPFVSGEVWGASVSIALWGLTSSAAMLGMQHRVVQASPAGIAWISSATFFGVALSGSLGTFAIAAVGAHYLTEVALIGLIIAALVGEIGLVIVSRRKQHTGTRALPTQA